MAFLKTIRIYIILALFLSLAFNNAYSQQIQIDRGVVVDGLWCFPLITDSLQYLYLPDKAQLALDENNRPKFSFMQYVYNDVNNLPPDNPNSIVKGTGGAILHFLVQYGADEARVRRAEEKLKEIKGSDNIVLRGPIIFKEGRFALVSSILNPENGKTEKRIMAMGNAPVLQGSAIALSFELDPQRSMLLMGSFKMPTPDISIVFDLSFSGLTDAYNAKLTVDWASVYNNEQISGGVKLYFVNAEVENINQELIRTGAIKLDVTGDDSRMQQIVDAAYAKVTEMMFEKVAPEQSVDASGSIGSMLNELFGKGGNFSANKIFPFGAHFGYKRLNIKTSGTTVMDFNSRISTDRHHYITFNMGDIYQKHGTDEAYFKKTLLDDIAFDQRQIQVDIDGDMMPEFENMINNVTVTLKKEHENGTKTIKELSLTKSRLADASYKRLLNYGNANDKDKQAWLNYEYQAQYSFVGGKTHKTDWETQSASAINLYTPFRRQKISIESDPSFFTNHGVRAVVIKLEYPFFGDKKWVEMIVRPQDDLSKKQLEITLPEKEFAYHYSIKWHFIDGREKISTGETESSLLFIDNLPN